MNICLYGASSPALDCVYFDAAEEFGRLLAQHGHTLVYGGGAGHGQACGAVYRGSRMIQPGGSGYAARFFLLTSVIKCAML